jgi:2-iminobutanoate/2-iminopropanoate deaminase
MDTNQRRCIYTENAPEPIGPYCQGNVAGPFVFTAAVGGLKPDGNLVEGGIGPETEQALKNIAAILEAGRCRLSDVAKVTAYLSRLEDFRPMNEVYQRFFGQPYPARSIVITQLPVGVVAFDAVALRPSGAETE